MGFPLEPAVQRLKIRKNKTRFDAMKVILIFLALLGRFGVRGIGTPELLLLLVTKEGEAFPRLKIAFRQKDHGFRASTIKKKMAL